jgi:hypothetical protein
MSKFLVKHDAVIGRSKDDGGELPPVELVFFTVVEAANLEAATDLIVQYSDPGFTTKMASVTELEGDALPAELLTQLSDGSTLRVQA